MAKYNIDGSVIEPVACRRLRASPPMRARMLAPEAIALYTDVIGIDLFAVRITIAGPRWNCCAWAVSSPSF
jgi:hypothetical protein